MKVSTFLPIFTGFHDTLWDADLEDSEEIDSEDFDHSRYRDAVSKEACKLLPTYFPTGMIKNCEFEKVRMSEDLYREKDEIHCGIEFDTDILRDYIYENKQEFEGYLHDEFTSRDGFISFTPNKFEEWKDSTKDFTDWTGVKVSWIGSVFNFVAQNEEKN